MIIKSTYQIERIETDTIDVPDCAIRMLLTKLGYYSEQELTDLLANPTISLSYIVEEHIGELYDIIENSNPDAVTTESVITDNSQFIGYTIEEVVTHA